MFSVEKISIDSISIKKTDELDKYVALMKKHNIHKDGYSLLPKNKWHEVSFELHNSNVGFANGLRRTLVGEFPVQALTLDEKDILTDDEFISGMNDVLVKNIGLIPIWQNSDLADHDIYLFVYNDTNDIIDIKASNISIVKKKNKRGGGSDKASDKASDKDSTDEIVDVPDATPLESDNRLVSKLFPETNITFMRLRPGKYLKLRNIKFTQGCVNDNAGNFTIFNNVLYKPLDVEPFDQFTEKGTRSIEHNCTKFLIGFTTCGNIEPADVISKTVDVISTNLLDIRKKVETYSKSNATAYYSGDACEVTITDGLYMYKFQNHYYTPVNMIAMQCYLSDENIAYCAGAVERYDTQVGIIRIKHPNPNEIILDSIDKCLDNLKKLESKFK